VGREIPRIVVDKVSSCVEQNSDDWEAIAFVDGVDTILELVDESTDSLTWNLRLKVGAEEAEIVTGCLI